MRLTIEISDIQSKAKAEEMVLHMLRAGPYADMGENEFYSLVKRDFTLKPAQTMDAFTPYDAAIHVYLTAK